MVVYLAYGSTANFRFRGPIAKINISKERESHGVRSGPRILEIDQVFRKLSQFSQVQSERERYLDNIIIIIMYRIELSFKWYLFCGFVVVVYSLCRWTSQNWTKYDITL